LERGSVLVESPDLHTWPEITGLTADSRKVTPGVLYCAVTGSVQDGHAFVADARGGGAAAARVEGAQPRDLTEIVVAAWCRRAASEGPPHSLDQGRVDGLEFRAALFTNLTRDHLDYHKTLDAYFRAKAKLAQYLAADGLEVVNADDPAWGRLRREHRRVTFGERGGEVTARGVTLDAQGAHFE